VLYQKLASSQNVSTLQAYNDRGTQFIYSSITRIAATTLADQTVCSAPDASMFDNGDWCKQEHQYQDLKLAVNASQKNTGRIERYDGGEFSDEDDDGSDGYHEELVPGSPSAGRDKIKVKIQPVAKAKLTNKGSLDANHQSDWDAMMVQRRKNALMAAEKEVGKN
jgi:hypothetical protein